MNGATGGASLTCHLCGADLGVRVARGRKSGKPVVMFWCPVDGRHIRAFVADQGYVRQILERAETAP